MSQFRVSHIFYLVFLAMFLVGCSVTVDLRPPWRGSIFRLKPPDNSEIPVTATPPTIATATPITSTITPILSFEKPIHILDIRPLTSTSPLSLTVLVDTDSMKYANGCDVNQALSRAPLSLTGGTVVAALTYISGTVSLSGSDANNRAAFAPSLDRTLYWSSDSGSDALDCLSTNTWLWQEVVLLPNQENAGSLTPALLSLPATTACKMGRGFTTEVFGDMVSERGEWPHLLYLADENDEPALLLLQQDTCSSGSGCAVVRTICQSLFEAGSWREWCQSLCS